MSKQANGKKAAVGLLASALVLAVSIGGTLAFMTRETEKRVNNFTFASDGIDAMLTEPDWDGIVDYEYDTDGTIKHPIYDYIDDDNDPDTPDKPVYGYIDGDKSKPEYNPNGTGVGKKATFDSTDTSFNPKYGVDESKDMIPGQEALKNPKITNTGSAVDEWVAAKVTFVYPKGHADEGKPLNQADLETINNAISIAWNIGTGDTNWELIEGTIPTGGAADNVSTVLFYRSILDKVPDGAGVGEYGEESEPIFTSVTMKTTATSDQAKALQDMGGFAIYVEGFAVQSDAAADYTAFKAYGIGADGDFTGTTDNGVVFENTPTATNAADVDEPGIIQKP